ncbi:MAG: hypothetical protein J7K61_05745 [Thermoplasmata archaeon]|nr:hypothetical protein [Thermoplasmata archaeon]
MDRNDKLVALAGIVVLIIALIGVAYHEQTYSPEEKAVESGMHSYRIEWVEKSEHIVDNGYVGRDGWSGNYTIDVGDNNIIGCAEISIEWTDNLNFHGFIFPWNWSDLIEAKASIDEFGFSKTASGYSKITMEAEHGVPDDKIVKAKNESEALKSVKGVNRIVCNLDLTIKPKPIIFDRGNDFTVTINYHYYEPKIVELS